MSDIGCLEAEQAVLGCLLSLPVDEAKATAWRLRTGDFTDPRHRLVFEAVGDCLLGDVPADPVTVLGELRRMGAESSMTADKSAGVFLADLMAAAPAVTSAGHYACVVVEHSARRRLAEAAERLAQIAGTGPLDTVREVMATEWTDLFAAFHRIDQQGDVHRDEHLDVGVVG